MALRKPSKSIKEQTMPTASEVREFRKKFRKEKKKKPAPSVPRHKAPRVGRR